MNYLGLIADNVCSDEFKAILGIIKFVLNVICIAIPIILIVLIVLDLAKIVTAGNANDDKVKKEVTSKVVTRIIFAVLIFLVPTIVKLIFGLIPLNNSGLSDTTDMGSGSTWRSCWDSVTVNG